MTVAGARRLARLPCLPVAAALLALVLPAAAATDGPDARSLWSRRCHNCHGPGGKGPERSKTGERIPDLSSADWQAARSDAAIRAGIENGVKDTRMKGYKQRLSTPEIAALTALVRGFRRPAAPATGK